MSASPEKAMVAWLKADTTINSLTGGRVATELPPTPTLEFMVVTLIGGGPEDGEPPTELYNLQVDCLANTKGAADALFRALVDASRNQRNRVVTSPDPENYHVYGVIVGSVRTLNPVDALDAANQRRYGYVVDTFASIHD